MKVRERRSVNPKEKASLVGKKNGIQGGGEEMKSERWDYKCERVSGVGGGKRGMSKGRVKVRGRQRGVTLVASIHSLRPSRQRPRRGEELDVGRATSD